ncbi:MAG: glycosyltransferase, partial [Pseudanabaena sp.]
QFTISNKLFQYLQAGLAIIATNTEGQSEILSQYPEVGQLILSNDPIALANAINNLVNNYPKLILSKQAALKTAKSKLNWESQENTILRTLERVIS